MTLVLSRHFFIIYHVVAEDMCMKVFIVQKFGMLLAFPYVLGLHCVLLSET